MEAHEFKVAPVSPVMVFGHMAPFILAELANKYESEAKIQVKHWAMWVFPNGCAVPVPTQIDTTVLPTTRACQLFKQALDKLAQVKMRSLDEADKFNLSTTIAQLKELMSVLGAA